MLVKDREETLLKRDHIALMKHPETAFYSGVMLMGKSEVVDEGCPTAYTDGVNKVYGRAFLKRIATAPKRRGLVLHENLHVALKHMTHGSAMMKEHSKMANLAADFVVNDIIENIKGCISGTQERIVELPDGAVYDEMFHNWSMREVFNYLKKHAKPKPKPQNGKPCDNPTNPDDGDNDSSNGGSQDDQEWESVEVNGKTYDLSDADEHDFGKLVEGMTPEQLKEVADGIDKALREGGILAGRMGAKLPKTISDLLAPKIDWRDALRDFVNSSMRGNDEFTWRKMNKRHLANDIYTPSMENETIGEIVVAIDTSGSIGGAEITEFATELVSICDIAQPEKVRVLWWDTEVHGEQVFERSQYANIAGMLKPLGGGGTMVSCVNEYVNKERIEAECVIVFTDGYVEGDIQWTISSPTLWMITRNKHFEPPVGKMVVFGDD
jgi:predicted metal-dependent peptidase